MKKIFITVFIFISVLCYANTNDGTAIIISYNTKRLGHGNKDYMGMAATIAKSDVTGLVEVMNRAGLDELIYALIQTTNEPWGSFISERAAGSDRYKEYFAFVWKKSRVSLVKSFGFYKELQESDFSREPYGVELKIDNYIFTYVLCHIIWGTDEQRRINEIKLLPKVYTYFQTMNRDNNDVYIAGDFNMEPNKPVWSFVTKSTDNIRSLISYTHKTTVGMSGLVSSYDNIIISKYSESEFIMAGVLNIPSGIPRASYREDISDHLPVYVIINTLPKIQ